LFVCLGFFPFLLCVWARLLWWVVACSWVAVSSSRRFFLRSSASAGRQRGAYAQVSVPSDSNHAAPAAAASAQDRDKLGFGGGEKGFWLLSFCYWPFLLKDWLSDKVETGFSPHFESIFAK
jgi:hypothetical protein